jgi:hypothetical protein
MGGRKQSVQLMDRSSLADISPVQIVDTFEGGVWLVWQYRFEALCNVKCGGDDWDVGVMNVQGRSEDASELRQRRKPSHFCCSVRCHTFVMCCCVICKL